MPTFNFRKLEKVTMWQRGKFQVEAENYDDAVAKVRFMMEKDADVDAEWDNLIETICTMTIDENQGMPTIEVISDVTNDTIYSNEN